MKRINVLLMLFLVIFSVQKAFCQPESYLLIGLGGGYNRTYSDMLRTFEPFLVSDSPDNTSGGYFFSLFIDFPTVSSITDNSPALRLQLSYNSFPMMNKLLLNENLSIITENGVASKDKYYKIDEETRSNVSQLSLDLFYNMPLFGSHFSIMTGASLGYLFNSNMKVTWTLTDTGNVRFVDFGTGMGPEISNNGRTLLVSEGKIPELNKYRFSVNIGAAYDFDIFSSTRLSPYINYNICLTRLVKENAGLFWKVNTLQAGLNIIYALPL